MKDIIQTILILFICCGVNIAIAVTAIVIQAFIRDREARKRETER